MYDNKNEQNTGTKTIKKIGKATYEVVVVHLTKMLLKQCKTNYNA